MLRTSGSMAFAGCRALCTSRTTWSLSAAPMMAGGCSMKYFLIVDDDPAFRRATTRQLSPYGKTVEAPSAETAVRFLDATMFDAVITDFEMPHQNGVWLLERVRERQPDARRVLMSGSEPQGLAAHIGSGLVQKWLPKPFTDIELLACARLLPAMQRGTPPA